MMANDTVSADLDRMDKGLNQRALAWRPIFKTLADAGSAAWDRFAAVLNKAGLDTWAGGGDLSWHATAFDNIRLGDIPAYSLATYFFAPLRSGLMIFIYKALGETTDDHSWGYWQNSFTGNLTTFEVLPPLMDTQLTGGASASTELRRLAQHVNSLSKSVSIHEAETALMAMLYSPVFYPNVSLPNTLAVSLEVNLWQHYFGLPPTMLTGRFLDSIPRDFSAVLSRLKEFGWNNIAADFSDDVPTVISRLRNWCAQQIQRPLVIDMRFPPGVITYINFMNNLQRDFYVTHPNAPDPVIQFFMRSNLSWSDAGI